MFLSRQAYQDLKDGITQAQAEAIAQKQANIVLQANMDWFRHRLTQIEKERAQLIHHALGVKIPTPEFHKDDPVQRFMQDHNFSAQDIFRDLDDVEAQKQGVMLDASGQLIHQ